MEIYGNLALDMVSANFSCTGPQSDLSGLVEQSPSQLRGSAVVAREQLVCEQTAAAGAQPVLTETAAGTPFADPALGCTITHPLAPVLLPTELPAQRRVGHWGQRASRPEGPGF